MSQENLINEKMEADSVSEAVEDGNMKAKDDRAQVVVKPLISRLMSVHAVEELIYWRNMKKTGIIYGFTLLVLLSLSYFSFISVTAYLALAVLSLTISFRIYKNVLQAVQKSNEGHPFKELLEMDISLPTHRAHELVDALVPQINSTASKIRSLILVEDLVDTLKLGVLLWCMTYVGAWFNGMTLILMGVVLLFTMPKLYETYKVQIDHYFDIAKAQVKGVIEKVKAKIPWGKPKQP